MKIILFLTSLILVTASACIEKNTKTTDENEITETVFSADTITKTAQVEVSPKSGSNVMGVVNFKEVSGVVFMTVSLRNLAPGPHAIHIHEIGDCSSDDGKSAGGHWNPTGANHGEWGSDQYHLGDLGNIVAGKDSIATFTRQTNLWEIGGEDKERNIVGKAIIVHEGLDDFTTQPSGKAGKRIACGEIVRID